MIPIERSEVGGRRLPWQHPRQVVPESPKAARPNFDSTLSIPRLLGSLPNMFIPYRQSVRPWLTNPTRCVPQTSLTCNAVQSSLYPLCDSSLPDETQHSRIQTACLMVLVAVAITYMVYWLRPVLVPLVVAFFVVAHRDSAHLARLLDRIYAPRHAYVVHVDEHVVGYGTLAWINIKLA